ncbi:DUF262 domain-containing protein [Oscillatoriales cyanobacterium LEGE 11467]|uniref:DUF262 domain-containing protein n=1 Tax=Zarconia navalis LEGE 11467 TaxID=1828826 RepID=A0A928VXT0_9CYAN|nr:DUF262 domain-containing HNH endonuclease family protein [Zarconia navalis]MBE9040727.1 DUF262 domain-containing protein [Zarconia navalis LEGE 11467]
MATIESQDLSIGKLFNDFYIVPSYQREYVWEDEHVKDFFEDIHNEFSEDGQPSDYFIGSIIVCEEQHGLYEVIDGQQRITTAYILLCAIRDYLASISSRESIEKLNSQIASTDIDEDGNDVFRYRVKLQYEDSRGVLEKIANKEDQISERSLDTLSSKNIANSYYIFKRLLKNEFPSEDLVIPQIKRFYAYLNKSVILVRVKTDTRGDALRVFATVNNRGVNLEAIDLVKNLMFMKAKTKEYDRLKLYWKNMADVLFKSKEKPMRFMRYFIIAFYNNSDSLKSDIYGWFLNSKNQDVYQKNPVNFVNHLLLGSKYYVDFVDGKSINEKYNQNIANIRKISSSARMPFMVLLAGTRLPLELFSELCKHVENIFFIFLFLRESTSSFEKIFIRWCFQIRNIKTKAEFDDFVNTHINTQKIRLAERFNLSFSNLEESSVPKAQLRYILAKLTQYLDENAYESDRDLSIYLSKSVEIEHILPQQPKAAIKKTFDKPDEIEGYIKKLGNLTLLEKSINKSIGNKPFEEKKVEYPKSQYILTRSISEKIEVGKNTAINRATANLQPFDEWTSESIEQRQKMLTELAKKVWEMP